MLRTRVSNAWAAGSGVYRQTGSPIEVARFFGRIAARKMLLALDKPPEPKGPAPDETTAAVPHSASSPLRGREYADFTPFECTVLARSSANLVVSPEASVSLMRAVGYVVENRIPGALVECGVYAGGSVEVILRTLLDRKVTDRDIYLYDTFAGMPRPDVTDDEGLNGALRHSWEAHRTGTDGDAGSTWMRVSVETVRARLDPLGYPVTRLHYVKGMVEDTIPETIPEQIAILRLDTDFYASTKHELVHLYPRLSPGGILIIDDYGAMPGCRRAVDEYATEHQLCWFLARLDPHVRLIIKG